MAHCKREFAFVFESRKEAKEFLFEYLNVYEHSNGYSPRNYCLNGYEYGTPDYQIVRFAKGKYAIKRIIHRYADSIHDYGKHTGYIAEWDVEEAKDNHYWSGANER